MKKSEVQPGSVVMTKIGRAWCPCTIERWSADKEHVIVRSCGSGTVFYRTPRQLILSVR